MWLLHSSVWVSLLLSAAVSCQLQQSSPYTPTSSTRSQPTTTTEQYIHNQPLNTFDTVLNNINANQASLNEQLKQLYNYQQSQQSVINTLATSHNDMITQLRSLNNQKLQVDRTHIQAIYDKINSLNIPVDNTNKLNELESAVNEQKRLLDSLIYSLAQPRDDIVITRPNNAHELYDRTKRLLHSTTQSVTQSIPLSKDQFIEPVHNTRYNDAHTYVTGLGVQRGLSHKLAHFMSHIILLGFLGLMLLIPILLLHTFLSTLLFNKNNNKRHNIVLDEPTPNIPSKQHRVTYQPSDDQENDTPRHDNLSQHDYTNISQYNSNNVNDNVQQTINNSGGVRITQIDNGYTTYKAPIVDRDNNRYIDSTSAHPAAIRDRITYTVQPESQYNEINNSNNNNHDSSYPNYYDKSYQSNNHQTETPY